MAFDLECLNIMPVEPLEATEVLNWQKVHALRQQAFDSWKQLPNKRVEIDGVKYKLVPLFEAESNE